MIIKRVKLVVRIKSYLFFNGKKYLYINKHVYKLDRDIFNVSVYSLEAITAITMTFFIDGYETSSTLMAFTLFMLGLYPNVQEKVREEVEALSHINYETVHDLKYLDAVINGNYFAI